MDLEQPHEYYMDLALREAVQAEAEGEVPVGAVAVFEGRIVARSHNQRVTLCDPTAHAEMIALTQAASAIGDWRLSGVTLYVTKEPCPMCAGALVMSRLTRVVFGARDFKGGACGSLVDLTSDRRFNHAVEVIAGVREGVCADLLTVYFKRLRLEKKDEEREGEGEECDWRGARVDEWDGLENRWRT